MRGTSDWRGGVLTMVPFGDDRARSRMRGAAIALLLLVAFLPPLAAQTVPPAGADPTAVRVSILGVKMAEGHALWIELV